MAKYRLSVHHDHDYEGPRNNTDCNLGIMATWHRNYSIGDDDAKELLVAEIRKSRKSFSHDSPQELFDACEKAGMIVLPVYAFEHGSITISTTPYQCRFDSGQLGFIATTRKRIREMLGLKRIGAKTLTRVFDELVSEVSLLDKYLCEGGCGYLLEELTNGDWVEVDACWGFLGKEIETNGVIDSARENLTQGDELYLYDEGDDSYKLLKSNEQEREAA